MSDQLNNQRSGHTGPSIGFFLGLIAGVFGTYMLISEEGKQLKKKLYLEFQNQKHIRTLEEIGVSTTPTEDKVLKTVQVISTFIKQLRHKINKGHEVRTSKKSSITQSTSIQKKHYFKAKG